MRSLSAVRSLLLLAIAATSTVGPVAILDAPVPDGFDFASEPPAELTFEEYAQLAHDSVEHVDTASTSAQQMTAAVDVWTTDSDDILLREVTRWGDESDAAAYVEQATALGVEQDLEAADPPIAGGVAFAATSAGLWTRTTTWQQGDFAITIEHFSLAENDGGVLREAAESIEAEIASATGAEPSAINPGNTEERPDGDAEGGSGGGSGRLATTLLGVAAIGVSVVLIARFLRRQRPAS